MIKIRKSEVLPNVFLLEFENNIELGTTFLRFQEYYESPEFKGRIFTFEEFKRWYCKDREYFSYFTDWTGFNIPSYILNLFLQGKFNPLSENEKQLLNLFEKEKNDFYIIGISEESKHLLDHEIAHGLYYTNEDYRREIINVLNKYDVAIIKDEIRATGGYSEEVLDDEVHAWLLDIPQELKSEIPVKLKNDIRKTFEKFKKNKNKKII